MTALSKLLAYQSPHLATAKKALNNALSRRALSVPPVHASAVTKVVPEQADVVIIGGGSAGCNTLYHLTKLGVTNAVLLEKDKLTAGTTWHTAGLVWRLRPSDVEVQLLATTHDLLVRLKDETGLDPGWINNGGIFIANNKERLSEYQRLQTLGRTFGIESHVLSPTETKKLYPLMNVSDVYGTLYSPRDGTVDPSGFCHALTRWATRAGAKCHEDVTVLDVLTETNTFGAKCVRGVVTNHGTIRTDCVVNCTGAWANDISHKVGIHTPLVVYKHAYVTTERIEGIENMPNIRDHDASVYLKLQGDALHVGGYEVDPIFIEKSMGEFAFSLFELDWEVFGVHIEGAVNRVPVLKSTGIKSTVCGPESFTPDHKPVLGEDPRVRGYFHGCGFNSAGMMLGGGCGDQLAKWIVHGRPELDMYKYDIRRFCPKVSSDLAWIKERSHESYAKNYSMVFPHDEPLAGRNMKKDALHAIMSSEGCVFQERLGWERPGWFSVAKDLPAVKEYDYYGAYDNQTLKPYDYRDKLALDYTFDYPKMHENIRFECLSTRNAAGLFNMSYFGKFYVSGSDAQQAVDWIFSNKLDVPHGKTVYTCMLNKRAGVEADLTVSVIDADEGLGNSSVLNKCKTSRGFYVAAAGGSAYHNLTHIRQTIEDLSASCGRKLDVHVSDASEHMGLISLQGPNARDILSKLTDADLSNAAFPFSTHKVIEVAGHKVRALRVSFVGELGWELHTPNESCAAVYLALMAAGKDLGLVNAGYRAIDSLSIEKGYPHWHQELRLDDTPLESGLMFTCKLKEKSDFLGRKALEQQKAEGVLKKKVCFTIDDPELCLLGLEAIYRDGEVVGHIRRADFGFFVNKPIAYGYVRRPGSDPITSEWLSAGRYELESMGRRVDAHLHLKSPFDPKNARIQGVYEKGDIDPQYKAKVGQRL